MSEKAIRKVLEHAREGMRAREAFFEENAQSLVEIARGMSWAVKRSPTRVTPPASTPLYALPTSSFCE